MSRETEKLFREVKKMNDGRVFDSPEDFQRMMMEYINANPDLGSSGEPDAYDYMDKAMAAASDAEAVKYAKKALKLDPTLSEAKMLLVMRQKKKPEEIQHAIEDILKEEEENLARQGITEEENIGIYYGLAETRPYIRIYQAYINILMDQGKMRRAAEACRRVCTLNEADNLGIRHILMVIYAILEERELAEALDRKYQDKGCYMQLPLTALYYKLDDMDAAQKTFKGMCARNKSVGDGLKIMRYANEKELVDIMASPYVAAESAEELVLAFTEFIFLYQPMEGFVFWMEDNLPGGSVAVKRRPRGTKSSAKTTRKTGTQTRKKK